MDKTSNFWRKVFGIFTNGDIVVYVSPLSREEFLCRIEVIFDTRNARLVSLTGPSKGLSIILPLKSVRHSYEQDFIK